MYLSQEEFLIPLHEFELLSKLLDSAMPDKAQFAPTHAKTQSLNHTFEESHPKENVAGTAPQNEEQVQSLPQKWTTLVQCH